ncbi:hypothetical protein BK133_05065 [Paenibacillus sp. FSL H8-0548]|uniref:hypothetical protein n=1 Tax=Paenibacillus sp. FSL H8-0548 TaxID=1920422 RepID=UPI00096F9637|nr:hypothetical protein [Paenibacillus sp. FSL H8-0548]OMF37427.1 hypothetical protein BK133_05065 [Paenibacillus sp. FSL H8-0548]
MAKNVLQKHWNGTAWVELHPITKASNVIGNNGISVETQLANTTANLNATDPLLMMTYDFSGRVVHPDVYKVYSNFGRNGEETAATYAGYTYWMVATPFPMANDNYENPSLWVSNDGVNWVVPLGYTNPIVAPVDAAGSVVPFVNTVTSGAFNSDPDWLIDPDDDRGTYMKMIYRAGNTATLTNKIMYTESGDGGIIWSAPYECYVDNVNHNLSPAIVRLGVNSFEMYYVETTITASLVYTIKKRTSNNMKLWSAPINVNIPTLPSGRRPWHIDAIKTHTGVELLLNTNPASAHSPDALFILSSTDRVNFILENNGNPVVTPSGSGWDDSYIYRGTFTKRSDGYYQIWYSAMDHDGNYRIGYIDGDFRFGFNLEKGNKNSIKPFQRFFFNQGDLQEGFQSTAHVIPDTDLTFLGEINSLSGKRRIKLVEEVFVLGDLNVTGGAYNTGHFTLGAYHFWVDSTGKLRIKNGVPTTDTDGIVVGSQT